LKAGTGHDDNDLTTSLVQDRKAIRACLGAVDPGQDCPVLLAGGPCVPLEADGPVVADECNHSCRDYVEAGGRCRQPEIGSGAGSWPVDVEAGTDLTELGSVHRQTIAHRRGHALWEC